MWFPRPRPRVGSNAYTFKGLRCGRDLVIWGTGFRMIGFICPRIFLRNRRLPKSFCASCAFCGYFPSEVIEIAQNLEAHLSKRTGASHILGVVVWLALAITAGGQQGARGGQRPNHSRDTGGTKYSPVEQMTKPKGRNLRNVRHRPALA